MRNLSRGAALTVALAAALLTGCSSDDDAQEEATPSSASQSPPTYGSTPETSVPAPTSVASDPEPSAAPVGTGSVRITYADWNPEARVVEAGGILPDVVEVGGVCTLTLSKDGESVTATVEGLPDARSTNCGGLVIADTLSAGTWSAVIDYRSARTEASSEPAQVQIP